MKKKHPTTEEVIKSMLTENTGRHFLDSGGAYGRNWERNQVVDFDSQPAVNLDVYTKETEDGKKVVTEIVTTVNVYHFLVSAVAFAPEMDRKFHLWAKIHDSANESNWLCLMEEFTEALRKKNEVGGLYGDGEPFTVNTYNGEDALSQVLQYHYFECDGEPYVILQIHGGCDVRGGYTAPRVFYAPDEDTTIFDNAKVTIGSKGLWWYSDNAGYHWEPSCFSEEYEDGQINLDGTRHKVKVENLHSLIKEGKVFADDNGNAICPYTGQILEGWI